MATVYYTARTSRTRYLFLSFWLVYVVVSWSCLRASAQTTDQDDTVTLIFADLALLSGSSPEDCQDAQDPSFSGGVATLMAYARNNTLESDRGRRLILPHLDVGSTFAQMHPLGWSVNLLVYRDLYRLEAFTAIRTLTDMELKTEHRDLSDLQSPDFPLLLSTLNVDVDNPWKPFVQTIHFHAPTGLAVIMVNRPPFVTSINATIEPCQALLAAIQQINQRSGCFLDTDDNPPASPYEAYVQAYASTSNFTRPDQPCWLPVLIAKGFEAGAMEPFLQAMVAYKYPPAFLFDTNGRLEETYSTPALLGNHTWMYSRSNAKVFQQLRFHFDQRKQIQSISVIRDDMKVVPDEVKDEQFVQDVGYMRMLADQARNNDPAVGMSGEMPLVRPAARSDDFRACYGGECPLGNLFTDALRWSSGADLAILSSSRVRGEGWPEGPVHVSDLYRSYPFVHSRCEVVMSGLSLFRLFNYTTSRASFEPWFVPGTNHDLLLQVSGARITYNKNLANSRLIGVQVWDANEQIYAPLERLRLYKVAATTWECTTFQPLPQLLGEELVIKGEQPAQLSNELLQNVVGDYLTFLNRSGTVYSTAIQGRMVNQTNDLQFMDWIQTKETCPSRTYWVEDFLSCLECPILSNVQFGQGTLETEGISGQDDPSLLQATVVNGENYTITVLPKQMPSWIASERAEMSPITLASGQSHTFQLLASSQNVDAGIAHATVSFAVQDGGSYPGCTGDDITFQVALKVAPKPELNKPEGSLYGGLALMAISCATSVIMGSWVRWYRKTRVVRALQPVFLIGLCAGTFVLSLSILPLSIVDDLSEWSARNRACQAVPWLVCLGFNLIMSSLYAKLWRINELFGSRNFARVTITAKKASVTTGLLFACNLVLLTVWTILDPLRWEIRHIPGEAWNQYGSCTDMGNFGTGIFSTIFALSSVNLFLASYQAFKARNISDEFSISSSLGFAVFTAFQILLVGVPILFLISEDNPDARYLLQTMMIFAICMSGLLLIFVPIIILQLKSGPRPTSTVQVSGLHLNSNASFKRTLETAGSNTNIQNA